LNLPGQKTIDNKYDWPGEKEDNPIIWSEYKKTIPKDFQQFNGWLGYPVKEGREYPIFPYELEVRDRILKHRHVVINKFVGAGMTELIPRIMLDMMLNFDDLHYSEFAIISGTRMKFTVEIIKNRILPIILRNHHEIIDYSVNEEIKLINGRFIRGYPTENLPAMHGADKLQFIFVPEAAFFHPNVQEQLMIALERNDTKSQPHIVLNSTPNGPEGAFYRTYLDALSLENDYDPITLNYTLGIGTIFTEKDLEIIENKKRTNPRLFDQEYNNQFIAPLGAVLPPLDDSVISDRTGITL